MAFRLFIVPFVCLLSVVVTAQDFHAYTKLGAGQIGKILSTQTRTVIDLSGPWQKVDGDEQAGTIDVPSSWAGESAVTVRKTIKIDAATIRSRSWSILFFGSSDEVDLRINGRPGIRHPGGSAPFLIRIPERMLVGGSNTIEISVASSSRLTQLVSMFQRSARSARVGLLRELMLVGTPHVWTSDVKTTQKLTQGGSSARIHCIATVSGAEVDRVAGSESSDDAMRHGSIGVTVEAVLTRDATGDVVARSSTMDMKIERSRDHSAVFDLDVSAPSLWTPNNPNLYTLTIRVARNGTTVDVSTTSIGVRSVRVGTTPAGRRIFVNDSLVFLSGVSYYDEYPVVGPSMSYRQMEHDVAMLKTLGVNLVRFVHSSPHPYMLHLCDRYGLMVMTELEAADVPKGLLHEDEVIARLRNRATLLATYVGTHPSVIACGISDGLQENTNEANAYHADVAKIIRSTVSTLIYKVVPGTLVDNISEGGFDIIVLGALTVKEREQLSLVLQRSSRTIRTAAVLTSVGSLVSPVNMNGYSDPLSNEAQAIAVRDGYRATQQGGCAGSIIHAFNDFRLEFPTMLVDQAEPHQCTYGLVDAWRQPRVSYSMLKALINDEKEPLLQAREFDDATPLVFIVTGIVLALILTFMANRSRRFREYFLRAIIRPYNFYADIRDQRILSLAQSTMLAAAIASCMGLVLGALLYYMRTHAGVEYLLHLFIPSETLFEMIRFMAWRPAISVSLLSVASFGFIMMLGMLLKIGGSFVKGRIFFHDTLTIVAWSSIPMLALLPFGIALYQMLSTEAITLWVPSIIFGMALWSFLRILRATSVVFDVSPLIVFSIGFGVVVLTLGLTLGVWAMNYDGFEFLQYYRAVVSA